MYLSRRAEMAEAEMLSSPLKLPTMQTEEPVNDTAATKDTVKVSCVVAGAVLDCTLWVKLNMKAL